MTARRHSAGRWRRFAPFVVVLILAMVANTGSAAAQDLEQIEGNGSTWSENALRAWAADLAPEGVQVVYTGGGSSVGRNAFRERTNDFALSEIPYGTRGPDGNVDTPPTRPYAYLPIVAGGTSFSYQIRVGGQLVRDLRLSGETIARIFTNSIRTWNDPAITADNNGRVLPAIPIIPVVRSDGSGTTAQFTRFLDSQYPQIWRPYAGFDGLTSNYPRQGAQAAANQSDGVMNFVSASAGNGSIGYVEYSYARNKNYPVAKVLNRGGFFVEPTDFNVAVALTRADINRDRNSPDYLTQNLDRVYTNDDRRAYPLSSYSYMIIPLSDTDPRVTPGKRQTLARLMFWGLCEGQQKMGALGYSPLPVNLAQAGFEQIDRLPGIDRGGINIADCRNPTFDPADLNRNRLAEIAPQPPACDAVGQGPCSAGGAPVAGPPAGGPAPGAGGGGGTGGGPAQDTGGGAAGTGGAGAGGTGTAGTEAGGTAAAAGVDTDGDGIADTAAAVDADGDGVPDAAVIDPETGEVVGAGGGAAGGSPLLGTATELAAFRSDRGMTTGMGALVAGELLLVLLVPALAARAIARRRTGSDR